ncbi:maleylpyruvate isomerase family mycothiol-dependent enzyme [Kitasatospora sp. NBC_01302]|uniref:maleylpyruvate isomerase family mycothiol-dependent enzyme n=1 Tax=Kitasatospora sp. NBC_01302 TaxID=2903575 RepID=UPI002E0F1D2E|nr:maleylpyruvate isomerase family mycothiol-dependent enzyme [Kitasatospora sp. NBC_01302]
MDYVPQFRRDALAFEAAIRRAADAEAAPLVPSCPGWSVADLVVHLGGVHRYVARLIRERLVEAPDHTDLAFLELPADTEGWPRPEDAPSHAPLPASLIDWFTAGAVALESLFERSSPDDTVWTWSREQTTGFWVRMQSIEMAVHRWDAENALAAARPIDAVLAADAVAQTFEVMAPGRRVMRPAPPGAGERFRFRQTDGAGDWTVRFEGDEVRFGESDGPGDVELAGSASDLMLYLWQRIPADRIEVKGDREVFDRWFTLVPPV